MCKVIAQWGSTTPYRAIIAGEDTCTRYVVVQRMDSADGDGRWADIGPGDVQTSMGALLAELASGSIKLVRR